MIQPVFRVLTTHPQLLVEHAQAYAELVSSEASRVSSLWQRRLLLWGLCAGFGVVACVLGGVAILFWVTLPVTHGGAVWPLVAVPAVPLVLALAFGWAARQAQDIQAFANLRQQLGVDWVMLRDAGEP